MTPHVLEHFQTLCLKARKQPPSADAALDAFGYLIWLSALGETSPVPRASVMAMRRVGQQALATLEGTGSDSSAKDGNKDDDAESLTHASRALAELLRVGLQLLDRQPITHTTPANALHPPSATLARMLEAKADGLTAGRYGLHVLGCGRCQALLSALPQTSEQASRVQAQPMVKHALMDLAASPRARIRTPDEGVVVARRKSPEAEAVLFQDADTRRLAVYTTADVPLRIVAEGITTEAARGGYWIGRLDKDLRNVDATLHYAKSSVAWKLKLENKAKRPKK